MRNITLRNIAKRLFSTEELPQNGYAWSDSDPLSNPETLTNDDTILGGISRGVIERSDDHLQS